MCISYFLCCLSFVFHLQNVFFFLQIQCKFWIIFFCKKWLSSFVMAPVSTLIAVSAKQLLTLQSFEVHVMTCASTYCYCVNLCFLNSMPYATFVTFSTHLLNFIWLTCRVTSTLNLILIRWQSLFACVSQIISRLWFIQFELWSNVYLIAYIGVRLSLQSYGGIFLHLQQKEVVVLEKALMLQKVEMQELV